MAIIILIAVVVIGIIGITILLLRTNKFAKLLSVLFVANTFDQAKEARGLLREIGSQNIVKFFRKHPEKTQIALQLIYAFNRIAGTVQYGFLDRRAVFAIWLPSWFIANWERFKPFIQVERDRRKMPELYANFEWLAEWLRRKYSG